MSNYYLWSIEWNKVSYEDLDSSKRYKTYAMLCHTNQVSPLFLSFINYLFYLWFGLFRSTKCRNSGRNSVHNIKLKAYRNIYTSHITKEIQFRVENERKIHFSSWNKTSIVLLPKSSFIQSIKLEFEIGILEFLIACLIGINWNLHL